MKQYFQSADYLNGYEINWKDKYFFLRGNEKKSFSIGGQ